MARIFKNKFQIAITSRLISIKIEIDKFQGQ